MKHLVLLLSTLFLSVGCSGPLHEIPSVSERFGTFWNKSISEIEVVNLAGEALPHAQVMIGHAPGEPFSNNILTTNSQGKVTLPSQWKNEAPVTVEAPGYVRVSYLHQKPGSLRFVLKPKKILHHYEVRGKALDLPVQDRDGFIDFGLILPAFSRNELLSFSMDSVVSPQTDEISIMGFKVPLPSNISLPKQTERYSLLSITMDKPSYRVYLTQKGIHRVFAAKGRFPFKSTVDEIRGGKEFYELINSLSLTGGTIRDIEALKNSTELHFPMHELSFAAKTSLQAPTLRADETFIAMGISENSGYLIPTDIKKLTSKANAQLNLIKDSKAYKLGALMKAEDLKNGVDRMSASLVPATEKDTAPLLPLINSPAVTSTQLKISQVSFPPELKEVGTYSLLSHEETAHQGTQKVLFRNPQWEVYSPFIETDLDLPQFPTTQIPSGKQRWEINILASQNASQIEVGPAMIEATTHVTHSSTSF